MTQLECVDKLPGIVCMVMPLKQENSQRVRSLLLWLLVGVRPMGIHGGTISLLSACSAN